MLNSRYDEIGELLIARQDELEMTLKQSSTVNELMATTKSFVKREEKKLKDLCKQGDQVTVEGEEKKQLFMQSVIDLHKVSY